MEFDKNIPVPKQYPWRHMKPGESIFFDNEPLSTQSKAAKSASAFGIRNNAKFSSRTEGNGVRIWRVA